MATRTETITHRNSDLSGVDLSKDDPFVKLMLTVDGDVKRVELDMSTTELATLQLLLDEYFKAGNVSTGKTPVASTQASQAMRNWAVDTAKAAGGTYTFDGEPLEAPAPRGRLSAQWVKAYEMAHETPKDEHASEAAINAAIAAGEASKDASNGATPAFVAPKPASKTSK